MSILMFSGMRKPVISFVFRKNIVKSVFIQIKARATGYHSETAANIVLANSFFLCFDDAWLVPYGDN